MFLVILYFILRKNSLLITYKYFLTFNDNNLSIFYKINNVKCILSQSRLRPEERKKKLFSEKQKRSHNHSLLYYYKRTKDKAVEYLKSD